MRRADREITDIKEIELIISKSDVCRVAFADNGYPYIVTMNFGYSAKDYKKLYFHCAPEGKKLEMISRNNYVCFSMDTDHRIVEGNEACDFTMNYSSVVGYGTMKIIEDAEEKIEAFRCIMSQYKPDKSFEFNNKLFAKTIILKCEIDEMTGKRC